MKFVPTLDRVIVKQDAAETKTDGGLYIPETNAKQPLKGLIVAVGPGKVDETGKIIRPMSLKAGDEVLFARFAYENIELDDEPLLIMKEDDILGKIEED